MIYMKKLLQALLFAGFLPLSAQNVVKNSNWEWHITQDGYTDKLIFKEKGGSDTIPFFKNQKNDGPCFYIRMDGQDTRGKWIPDGEQYTFRTAIDGVECRILYHVWNHQPAMTVTMINNGNVPFQPDRAGLKLGIDTYMDKYPDWFGKYFPTLMRNEKTHFYGYLQTPKEHTLALVSPHPIASWSVDYNLGYMDPKPFWFMGHRIESLNLDLINALPLPERNPQNLWQLKQGESKTWTIAFVNIRTLDNLETALNKVARIPLIQMEQTAYRPGEEAQFEVIGEKPIVKVTDDKGNQVLVTLTKKAVGRYLAKVVLPTVGLYQATVIDGDKESEAVLTAHATWRWTLEQARKATMKYHQKATSHAESWYGFYSAFIAGRYFPDSSIDEAVAKRFDFLYDLLHDKKEVKPLYYGSRIQNTSTTIGMLVDKYEAEGKMEDLEKASLLADWLIDHWQREDGAYVNRHTVYTSVIYVAKSILELTLAEQKLAEKDSRWKSAAERHYNSAKCAIDQLVHSRGDFQTEGEMTFEDGMISCSALQIGMLALMQKDETLRKYYADAMLEILKSHSCLTQLRVPDGRRRGGTMRYWEAQYDVEMLPNMFNSPHGWSGWRGYATYYAYLLTGDEEWLKQTFNAMGAFSNLIDYKNGDLRWAFVVDPYVQAVQACSHDTRFTADSLSFGNPQPRLYDTRKLIIGEQYVNMISDWQTINSQDNDVHELFKCIGETVLTNAFVIERPNGEVVGYNCRVSGKGNTLTVKADEKQIVNLHCNLKQPFSVTFGGKSRSLPKGYCDWAFGQSGY